jgi:hypothetical protein
VETGRAGLEAHAATVVLALASRTRERRGRRRITRRALADVAGRHGAPHRGCAGPPPPPALLSRRLGPTRGRLGVGLHVLHLAAAVVAVPLGLAAVLGARPAMVLPPLLEPAAERG